LGEAESYASHQVLHTLRVSPFIMHTLYLHLDPGHHSHTRTVMLVMQAGKQLCNLTRKHMLIACLMHLQCL